RGLAAEELDQSQQHDRAHHRTDKACRAPDAVKTEGLAAVGCDYRADDADQHRDPEPVDVRPRTDPARHQPHQEADQDDEDDVHGLSVQTSKVASTGTWSEASFQSR